MIRHAGGGSPLTKGALAIAMIGPAFGRLLMTAVGLPALDPAGQRATGRTAVGLAALTGGADEEEGAAIQGTTKALPKGSRIIFSHTGSDRMDSRNQRWQNAAQIRLVLRKRSIQGVTPVVSAAGVI